MPINVTQLRRELGTSVKQLKPLADANAKRSYNAKVEDIIDYYDNHEVTSEIRAGKDSASSFLPVSEGNLFTFLGFNFNQKPANVLRTELRNHLRSVNVFDAERAKVSISGPEILYTYPVKIPSYKEISENEKFALPWSSRSWIDQIEKGITGLAYYLHSIKFSRSENSRSRRAFQLRKKVRNGATGPIPFLSDILKYARSLFQ